MQDTALAKPATPGQEPQIAAALGMRSIVLVGMMGAGKSSVGRRLAARLHIPFVDADVEIEKAAGMSVSDIFATRGEAEFRAGEAKVIARLLDSGPQVLATGGGAVMNDGTRELIRAKGVSIWLKADLEVLQQRTRRRNDRPLADRMKELLPQREPYYAQAHITVESRDEPHEAVVEEIVTALVAKLRSEKGSDAMTNQTASGAVNATTVHVSLGDRSYDIAIGRGLLATLGQRIATLRPGAKVAIVSDETVARIYLAPVQAALAAASIPASAILVPAGEASKSFAVYERVCEQLIEARIERDDLVVALGGGVIGDLAGFASASVRRGLDFVQVPTTLLAQVDSSVGGKTGINSRNGKNLVGAFHQPALVIADTAVLDSLPRRDFAAGYAEMAKYGLLGDADFFAWLEAHWQNVFAGGPDRDHAIAVCCRCKADIVGRDERESGERALLNLGHTFGHAFEAAAGYSDRLLHGEAVAIGMALAFGYSARQGLIGAADVERVMRHLQAVGLPSRISELKGPVPDADRLMELIGQDKKVKRGKLTFILVRRIGEAFVAPDVDPADVRAYLAEKLSER
jgi:shikimate kinase/3-dehydroquinate synthase